MAWYSDYAARKDRLVANGLLVQVRGARIEPGTGFMAIYLEANQGDLLRSDADRGFALHMSLGFESDYGPGVADHCIDIINERWRGRLIRLKITWVGSGGAAFLAEDDALGLDYDIAWLYARGWYADRGMHISL